MVGDQAQMAFHGLDHSCIGIHHLVLERVLFLSTKRSLQVSSVGTDKGLTMSHNLTKDWQMVMVWAPMVVDVWWKFEVTTPKTGKIVQVRFASRADWSWLAFSSAILSKLISERHGSSRPQLWLLVLASVFLLEKKGKRMLGLWKHKNSVREVPVAAEVEVVAVLLVSKESAFRRFPLVYHASSLCRKDRM